jgi:SAM-dependent methyltransferase
MLPAVLPQEPTPETARFPDSLTGYRHLDAARYERRRYGSIARRMNHWFLERALGRALAPVAAGGLVLDTPSGTGILHGFLASRGYRVVASDLSRPMIAQSQRRGQAAGGVLADIRHLPFRRDSFDAVVCSRFIMHLPRGARGETLRTLAELSRGPVIATVCHPYTFKTASRAARRFLGGNPKQSPRITRRGLEEELAEVGLELQSVAVVLPILSEVWVASVRRL